MYPMNENSFREILAEEARRHWTVEAATGILDCFELAMRTAYRAALSSADFLYHVEPAGKLIRGWRVQLDLLID